MKFSNLTIRHKSIYLAVIILLLISSAVIIKFYFNDIHLEKHNFAYEKMTEAILSGNLYLDYGSLDQKLLSMDNPYDPQQRLSLGVNYMPDHALYNGKYYMYFGVAPVFLFFIPYTLIFGKVLSTKIAVFFFICIFIVGLGFLFYKFAQRYFKEIRYAFFLIMYITITLICIQFVLRWPVLYCLPIISGLACMVWSINFIFVTTYSKISEVKKIICILAGAICGALVFACRPPLGLANIFLFVFLKDFIKAEKIVRKNWVIKIIIAIIPYVVIALLLMTYNYLRFENPFEFGQSYQLTTFDQQNLFNFDMGFIYYAGNFWNYFLEFSLPNSQFPYLHYNGAFINYPILLVSLIVFWKPLKKVCKANGSYKLIVVSWVIVILIALVDTLSVPNVNERYRLDLYLFLGISLFLVIGNLFNVSKVKNKEIACCVMSLICYFTLLVWLVFFICPDILNESNGEYLEFTKSILTLGFR